MTEDKVLTEESREKVRNFFKSDLTIEIPVHSEESESTLYIVWEKQSNGDRYLDTAYSGGDKPENDKILEALTSPKGWMGITGNDRFTVSSPEEAIEHTEELLEEADMEFKEGSKKSDKVVKFTGVRVEDQGDKAENVAKALEKIQLNPREFLEEIEVMEE